METEWANALKEIPGTSLRPDSYKVVYEIEGKGIFKKTIENRAGSREIAETVNEIIPEDWNKFYFYAQISENGGGTYFFL